MYMSYCMMEGTLCELRACLGVADEHMNKEAEFAVSEREIDRFRDMVQEFAGWLYDHGIIDGGDLNESALDDVCECLRNRAEEDEYDN